jgi:hypothetical protein
VLGLCGWFNRNPISKREIPPQDFRPIGGPSGIDGKRFANSLKMWRLNGPKQNLLWWNKLG